MAGAQTGTARRGVLRCDAAELLPHASSSTSPAPIRCARYPGRRGNWRSRWKRNQGLREHTKLRSLVVFGGVDIKTQTPHLKNGVEILVATPDAC